MTLEQGTTEPQREPKPSLTERLDKDAPYTFGKRYLTNEEEVFNHNAWDHVEWNDDHIVEAQKLINAQSEHPVKDFEKKLYNSNPARYWDIFYKHNRENFFKDRKWLKTEFPDLFDATSEDHNKPATVLEIGCGAGNTFFPVLEQNQNPQLKIYACDYLKVAVDLIHENPTFKDNSAKGIAYSSVWDIANPEGKIPDDLEPNSCDSIFMIFIFLALHPDQWEQAISNLSKCLKPGGKILFRDYGRYDLAQLRFKKNRLLQDNFYIRGDGTRVYFFTEDELRQIFTEKGPFKEVQVASDKRLIVNRKKQLKMYRNWLQAEFTI